MIISFRVVHPCPVDFSSETALPQLCNFKLPECAAESFPDDYSFAPLLKNCTALKSGASQLTLLSTSWQTHISNHRHTASLAQSSIETPINRSMDSSSRMDRFEYFTSMQNTCNIFNSQRSPARVTALFIESHTRLIKGVCTIIRELRLVKSGGCVNCCALLPQQSMFLHL